MVTTTLQTLDRGLAALSLLAEAPAGLKPAELADRLGVHKAIAYRLLATLEAHSLIRRLPEGRAVLGTGLIPLAARVEKQRLAAAAPLLAQLSEVTRTTSCLVLADGANAVVAAVHEGGDGFLRVTLPAGGAAPADARRAGAGDPVGARPLGRGIARRHLGAHAGLCRDARRIAARRRGHRRPDPRASGRGRRLDRGAA